MTNDRRSTSARTPQPIHLLRETRYMSREEILRELRKQQTTGGYPSVRPASTQPRAGGSD